VGNSLVDLLLSKAERDTFLMGNQLVSPKRPVPGRSRKRNKDNEASHAIAVLENHQRISQYSIAHFSLVPPGSWLRGWVRCEQCLTCSFGGALRGARRLQGGRNLVRGSEAKPFHHAVGKVDPPESLRPIFESASIIRDMVPHQGKSV
jgi:hypothetical protein